MTDYQEVAHRRCVRKKTRPPPIPTLVRKENMAKNDFDHDELFILDM